MALSGNILLRIVAVVMILLGGGGLAASLTVFGAAQQQLGLIDETVAKGIQDVTAMGSNAINTTSAQVEQGVGSVVKMLDTTAASLQQTGKALDGVKGSIANVGAQVPQIANSAAGTLEKAAESVQGTKKDITAVEKSLGDVALTKDLKALPTQVQAQKDALAATSVALSGNDVKALAPVLAPTLGVPEWVIEDQGERMIQSKQAVSFNLATLRVSATELKAIADAAEAFNVDASAIKSFASQAEINGTVWTFFPLADLEKYAASAAASAATIDQVLAEARKSLASTANTVGSLSGSLQENAGVLRTSIRSVTGATDSTAKLLTETQAELAKVSTAIMDLSKTVNGMSGAAKGELGKVNEGLKTTLQSAGKISVAALGADLLQGLRTYMIITNSLFILTGIGLLAASMGAPRSAGAQKAA